MASSARALLARPSSASSVSSPEPLSNPLHSVINPTTGKLITKVDEATDADVDRAVKSAQAVFDTEWGLNASGARRAELLYKLGTLMDKYHDELAALEALDNGT